MKSLRIFRPIISLFAATAVMISGITVPSRSVEAKVYAGDYISYSITGGELLIWGNGEMYNFSDGSDAAPWQDRVDEITSVTVLDGITSVGAEAFYNMRNIRKVSLAFSVSNIGVAAFANCTGLREFEAPGLTSISDYAFQGTSIESFSVPYTLINITDQAFYDANIGKFHVSNTNPVYSEIDGVLMDRWGETLVRYPIGAAGTSYVVPDTVRVIGRSAFQGSSLKTVELKNIIEIRQSAFQSCLRLETVEIPQGVKAIPEYAFYACGSLQEIKLNQDLINIRSSAFASCSKLAEVLLPETIEFVHHLAFPSTSRLECQNESLKNYGINGFRKLERLSLDVYYDYDRALLAMDCINDIRKANGLNALRIDSQVMEYAMQRACETAVYPTHTRPDGSEALYGMYPVTLGTEIIATTATNPLDIAEELMQDSGDVKRILSPTAKTMGIGIIWNNGCTYMVMLITDSDLRGNVADVENKSDNVEMFVATTYNPPEINMNISFEKSRVEIGNTSTAKVYVKNRKSQSAVNLDSECFLWSSSDSEVAIVGPYGVVVGRGDGRVTIKATTEAGLSAKGKISVGKGEPVQMYRLYNGQTGEHLYTSSNSERLHLAFNGWDDEGPAWVAPEISDTPVYRMYNKVSGDHHYTTDKRERDYLKNGEWSYEGIGWYSDDEKTTPLYRLYNPDLIIGNHHYTADEKEKDALLQGAWQDEKIAWYGLAVTKSE